MGRFTSSSEASSKGHCQQQDNRVEGPTICFTVHDKSDAPVRTFVVASSPCLSQETHLTRCHPISLCPLRYQFYSRPCRVWCIKVTLVIFSASCLLPSFLLYELPLSMRGCLHLPYIVFFSYPSATGMLCHCLLFRSEMCFYCCCLKIALSFGLFSLPCSRWTGL